MSGYIDYEEFPRLSSRGPIEVIQAGQTGGAAALFPRLSSRGPIEVPFLAHRSIICRGSFRDYQVAAPLKLFGPRRGSRRLRGFRDYQVAAPLKCDYSGRH